jgi:hypothetical protein
MRILGTKNPVVTIPPNLNWSRIILTIHLMHPASEL